MLVIILLITLLVAPMHASRVCLNMIVKNEAKVIERALLSAWPLIDDWVISDTGSTDDTQELIQNFFASRMMPGVLLEHPWTNFEVNRNQALLGALEHSDSDYILFMDADDIFVAPSPSVIFELPVAVRFPQFMIKVQFPYGTETSRTGLISRESGCRWKGVLHESINCPPGTVSNYRFYNKGPYIKVIGGGGARNMDPDKFLKDVAVLETALKENPDDTRYQFYLAQSLKDAGKPAEALAAYLKRADMAGWQEEVFISLYEAAKLMKLLNYHKAQVMATLTRAHMARPHRIEALHQMAEIHRNDKEYAECMLVASLAIRLRKEVPKPGLDTLFLQTWIYDYGLLDTYSICAYFTGHYKESLDAYDEMIASGKIPDNLKDRITANRDFSLKALGLLGLARGIENVP